MRVRALFTRFALIAGLTAGLVLPGDWPSHHLIQAAGQQEPDTFLRVNSDLVTVDVTVRDEHGRFIHGLKASDFTLLEDGKPCSIDFFQENGAEAPRKYAMVFAIDFSGSVTPDESAMQRRALGEFLTGQNPESLFALIGFNHDIKVLENFTRDRQRLLKSFEKHKDYGGSTRIYDAVAQAITMLKKVPKTFGPRRTRKIVVVVTDGFDSSSSTGIAEIARRAGDEEVTIYSVQVPSYMMSMNGKVRVPTLLDASQLTTVTGGKDFPVENGKDYTDAFRAISEDVRESYTLAYQPRQATSSGQFHKISVTTKQPGLVLRTSRNGFSR
ncbi:MAG: VWA domain-containing protein [Blastocatellia bacterium]|nr:VWA domain-containing protein [Blastocatellia bacterium]